MTQRNLALDSARGFAVLFIAPVHCFLVYGQPYTHESFIALLLRGIAEGPGVHVFLMIMGIVFTFKPRHDTTTLLKRALLIFVAGYALNALKFVVPYLCGGLPAGVLEDLQVTPGRAIIDLLLMGDIFHCAAIALLILHAVHCLTNYWCWSIVLAIVMIIVSPYLFDVNDHYLAQLFTGAPPRVFFPVLSWLPYPLIGLAIGYLLQRRKTQCVQGMGITGGVLLLLTVPKLLLTGNVSPDGYYRPYALESLAHIGITLLALWYWHSITPLLAHTRFFQLLQFSSRNITVYYCLQWIGICWLLPFTGYQTMTLVQTTMMALYVTTVCGALTYFITAKNVWR